MYMCVYIYIYIYIYICIYIICVSKYVALQMYGKYWINNLYASFKLRKVQFSLQILLVSTWVINVMSLVFIFLYYTLQCKVSFKGK